MHIFDALHLKRLRSRSAHALAEWDANAGWTALERPEHQFAVHIAIEARPVEARQRLPDQGRGICHVGDRVGLARGQSFERRQEVAVHGRLVGRLDLEVVHQSNCTFPRVCFTALRCFFLSTRCALAARLGRVALRFAWTIWAAAIISATRRRASCRFASCVRYLRAVMSNSPAPVTRLPAMLFSRS